MTPAEARALRLGAEHLGVHLPPEAILRLDAFLALLAVWNERIRLTGERDPETIVRKHVVDSLAVVPHLPASGDTIDVGSGAGFPGIILGCVRPELPLVLIEARRRRASFLNEAVRSVGLRGTRVLEVRAEDAADAGNLRGRGALVIGRALRVDTLLSMAADLVGREGRLLAMQTPKTRPAAARAAEAHGFRLAGTHPYTLLDGERRLFFFFTRLSVP